MMTSNGVATLLQDFLNNGTLAWALIACGLAQVSKLLIEITYYKRWRPAVLIETGGMPSSHSALISGTAAGIGWEQGVNDPLFALSVAIAFIIMYDASGIRKAAGNISYRFNSLPDELWNGVSPHPLKENLGHTRLEVLVGSILGPTVVLAGLALEGSPLNIINRFV
uniref:Divergent PAP2 family protein n=1 Tax=Paulinella micropora TaxID=1928728 RepID=A0A385I179_9EUKA|nr:hypothetical protein PMNZ_768 [Paulinella micropora]AXY63689.1 hypothetical protein PMNZ_768 [Paulinella micropora]